ncbi:MAG: ABC transporter ATP-binding protein/permease [Lachnospiraceae bacterium]|nr:ABC transporter ATP-binding protein/permease [Lachnospiraceae bacterium]
MIKTLAAQVKQYKLPSLLTPFFMALEVVVDILLPKTMGLLIDRGIQAGSLHDILRYGAYMLLLALLGLIFGILAGKYAAQASSGFACNVRDAMYTNIQKFSFSNIDKFSTAGLITRLTTDVTNLQNAYQMVIRMCFRAPLMLIFSLVMAFSISARLSMVFVAALLILVVLLGFIISKAMKYFNEVFEKYDDLNASIQENVSAIRVVKAFVREDHENEKFKAAAGGIYKMFVRAESVVANNGPVMMLAVYSCMLSLSWLAARMITAGSLTTGELTTLFSYVMSILMSLMMLSMIFVMLTLAAASARRVVEVLNEKPDLVSPENALTTVADGSVDFEHVYFSYPKMKKYTGKKQRADKADPSETPAADRQDSSAEFVLTDVHLHVHPGETIGIIGGTGSAKSSLVNLISRLYDVSQGCVKVGGRDVREYDLDTLRNEVAVVLQKNVLFSGTILENLRWGDENASFEDCVRVCKLACADEFIEQFPDKYETYIEQGGTNVSGGQKQRLCIARALLKKPKILVLDDSTSAVDTATDARIRKAFREEIPDTTKFIIAQRISSIQDADRIIVLEDGVIDGFDTHENLLQNNAIYREVYESQTKGGGDFDQKGGAL